ncbi:MAG: 50S ribosomal protein L2 [Candidatus Woesearchaeota archaeon]|jgi:large subunit ribosomal protein L2
MGKNLKQQARGRGGPKYISLGFRSLAQARHVPVDFSEEGIVVDIVKCSNHYAPLVVVNYPSGVNYNIACEGVYVGQKILNNKNEHVVGNTLRLSDIAEGTDITNIESMPGDGGKFVRCPGTFAKLQVKDTTGATVIMPSKKLKKFDLGCRATIGIVAGSGRKEKPLMKAGVNYHRHRAMHKVYPIMSGSAQNAVDHPFGNKRTSRKSHAKPAPHNAPPGRNVGMIRPSRTGRKTK